MGVFSNRAVDLKFEKVHQMLALLLISVAAASEIAASCQPKKKLGVYCSSDDWCESGVCRLNQCVEASLTSLNNKPLPSKGQSCLEYPFKCASGLACYGGVCSELKQKEGDACSDIEFECGNGLVCGGYQKSGCVKLRDEGEYCTMSECKPGLYCRKDKCEPYKKEGQTCNFGRSCSPELVCKEHWVLMFPYYRCREPPTKCIEKCGDNFFCAEETK